MAQTKLLAIRKHRSARHLLAAAIRIPLLADVDSGAGDLHSRINSNRPCALSAWMIVARAIQGLGSAILSPST
jgi:hypothetical protein